MLEKSEKSFRGTVKNDCIYIKPVEKEKTEEKSDVVVEDVSPDGLVEDSDDEKRERKKAQTKFNKA
jgi:hypothetical protein